MGIREIDLRHARPDEYETLAAFAERLRSESDPGDPPVPLEEWIRRWQSDPPYVVMRTWVIGHPEQINNSDVTLERIRLHEQAQEARGDERWRIVARERTTGHLAGYTDVIWHPNRPELLQQGDTAVISAYQNRGLGRWLKAAMLEKVLTERPQVRRIRTGNAFVNEPMLKINRELGFRPYQSFYIWQVEVSTILAYLDQAGMPAR